MNNIFLITCFTIFCCFSLQAQKKDFLKFIPNGYDTLDEGVARGDLNKDGIEDVVLVLFNKMENVNLNDLPDSITENFDSLYPRILIILFGTKSGYHFQMESSKAVMCKECGGIFGDPFAGIEIRKHVLQIYHYGGSNWRWSYAHKFRYDRGNFYLIGSTRNSYWCVEQCEKLDDFAGTDYEDINFLTGEFERKKISEDCKLLENKKGKQKIQPLIALSAFDINNSN